MINNYICFRDYETGSKNKMRTQPIQLAAIMIDLPRLQIVPDSLFESKILPELDDEKAISEGMDPIMDEALKINGHTREDLARAPDAKTVWNQYLSYLDKYNLKGIKGGKWHAPIAAGFNNTNFDDYIDLRLAEKYGPKPDDYGGWSHYHPIHNFDVLQLVRTFFFSIDLNSTGSYSMDAVRQYFGYQKLNAHKADVDVKQGADLLLRFLKLTKRIVSGKLVLPAGKRIKFFDCVNGAL